MLRVMNIFYTYQLVAMSSRTRNESTFLHLILTQLYIGDLRFEFIRVPSPIKQAKRVKL